MIVRASIRVFNAWTSCGHLPPSSGNLQLSSNATCDRVLKRQLYSTNRLDSATLSEIATSGHKPKKLIYEDDPERRAKHLQRLKEYAAHRRATDPEYREKQSQWSRRNYVRRKVAESKYYDRHRDQMREYVRQPHIQPRERERSKEWNRLRRSEDPAFVLRMRAHTWIFRYQWFREDLPWTLWKPIFYPEKVNHWCQKCNHARYGGARVWWNKDSQDFMCHSCYMEHSEEPLPKGYEGCTTIREVKERKKTLESEPTQLPITSTLTGQSWKPPKTPPTGSRPFSTFHAVWNKSEESKFDEQGPDQDSQPQEWAELEAEMLEAKRQYGQIRSAWKLAQKLESGSQEVTDADVHQAKLRVERAIYAWKMVSDPGYKARVVMHRNKYNRRPEMLEFKRRWWRHADNRSRHIEKTRLRRANDPLLRLRDRVYEWVWTYPSVRRSVIWDAWQPILYSAKVRFHCQGCGHTRHDGLKLWWRRKIDSTVNTDFEVYSCHQCFIKSPDAGLPKAYKDCTTLRELNARFTQLEGVRPSSDPGSFDVEVGTMDQKDHDHGLEHPSSKV